MILDAGCYQVASPLHRVWQKMGNLVNVVDAEKPTGFLVVL